MVVIIVCNTIWVRIIISLIKLNQSVRQTPVIPIRPMFLIRSNNHYKCILRTNVSQLIVEQLLWVFGGHKQVNTLGQFATHFALSSGAVELRSGDHQICQQRVGASRPFIIR